MDLEEALQASTVGPPNVRPSKPWTMNIKKMVDFPFPPILWQFWTPYLFLAVQFIFGRSYKHSNSDAAVEFNL